MALTNHQWEVVREYVLPHEAKLTKRGRPALDKKKVMEAILWVLEKGARWKEMPDCYPQYQTCRNYFYEWSRTGAMERVVKMLAENLETRESSTYLQYLLDTDFEDHNFSKKKLSQCVQKIENAQQLRHVEVYH